MSLNMENTWVHVFIDMKGDDTRIAVKPYLVNAEVGKAAETAATDYAQAMETSRFLIVEDNSRLQRIIAVDQIREVTVRKS